MVKSRVRGELIVYLYLSKKAAKQKIRIILDISAGWKENDPI